MVTSFRKRFLVGISVILLGASTASPAGAITFPGNNGVIAYTQGHPARVLAVDPLSGTISRLAGAGAEQPTWSPNGKRFAYVRGGYVFVASMSGKDIYHVPHGKGVTDSAPVWSADGMKLAFVRTKQNGQSAVASVRVGSQSVTVLSGWSNKKNYRSPSWSPNGKEIVYEEYDTSSARIIIKNSEHGTVRELTRLSDVTDSSHASWSPNGNKILFRDSANELYTIWTDGDRRSVISDGDSYDGVWSPDGTMIAFIEDPGDETISVSRADGSINWLPIEKNGYDTIGSPIWSPDATKLTFIMTKNGMSDLWQLDMASGAQALQARGVSGKVSWQAR